MGGQNATCVDTNAKGGLTFVSREATDSGYQPFTAGNATTVSFYVKQTAHGASNIGAASGATIPPSVQLGLGDDETVNRCFLSGLPGVVQHAWRLRLQLCCHAGVSDWMEGCIAASGCCHAQEECSPAWQAESAARQLSHAA